MRRISKFAMASRTRSGAVPPGTFFDASAASTLRLPAKSASKAGEIQLVRVMALEMGKHHITCNVVAPGLTDISGISLSSQNPEYQKAFISQVPLGRLAAPDEVADAVLFIASDRARFISGQVLCVDGGYSAGKLAVIGPHIPAPYGMVDGE